MRIVMVIITGISLLFMFTLCWYLSNMIGASIVYAFWETFTLTEESTATTDLVTFLNIIWGPIVDLFVILWMIAAAQARDVESVVYG